MEVHGTVAQHGDTGGTVLLDDGSRLTYPLSVVQPEIRLLRSGQLRPAKKQCVSGLP